MTDERLAKIEDRLTRYESGKPLMESDSSSALDEWCSAAYELTHHAPADLRDLLNEVDRLNRELERMKDRDKLNEEFSRFNHRETWP